MKPHTEPRHRLFLFLGKIVSHHRLPDITNVSEDFLPLFVTHWNTIAEASFDFADGAFHSIVVDILAFRNGCVSGETLVLKTACRLTTYVLFVSAREPRYQRSSVFDPFQYPSLWRKRDDLIRQNVEISTQTFTVPPKHNVDQSEYLLHYCVLSEVVLSFELAQRGE